MNKTTILGLTAAMVMIGSGCGTTAATPPATAATCGAGTTLVNGVCTVAGDGTIAPDNGSATTDGGTTAKDTATTKTDGGKTPTDTAGSKGDTATTTPDTKKDPVDAGPTDPWCDCPPEKINPGGLEHGKKCDKHKDCLYGQCVTGGHLAGYKDSIKYCTKNNACSGSTAQCENDGKYKAGFEKTKESGNDKFGGQKCGKVVKMCAKQCKNDGECKAWNSELPDCIKTSTKYVSMGVIGICVNNPLK